MGKTYGTSPLQLLNLPLGEFEFLLRIFEEGSAFEALQMEKARQKAELEARRAQQQHT